MNNNENNEKSILIDQIISIMYEASAFKDIGMSKDFLKSTLKGHLESKSLEELHSDYILLQQTVVDEVKKR